MESLTSMSRWRGYVLIGLIVMAELVTVSGRGQIEWQNSFGPKERRKRQTAQNDAFGLLTALSRPAGQLPSSAGQPSSAGANGKQLDTGNAFGGLINGIFNQALSGFARPAQNGGIGIDLGTAVNPQAGWNIFGSGNTFQPTSPQGGDLNFPGMGPGQYPGSPEFCRRRPTHRRCRPIDEHDHDHNHEHYHEHVHDHDHNHNHDHGHGPPPFRPSLPIGMGSGQYPGSPEFCRRRPTHRRCRPIDDHGHGHGHGHGPPPARPSLPIELKGITWAQYIDSSSMLWLPMEMNVPGFISGRGYYLGFGNPDFAYQTCTTPTTQTGRCRFVQHCARPEMISSLTSFVSYACPIGSDYMGVCCPDNTQPTVPSTPPPPPPPPTPAVSTAAPATPPPTVAPTTVAAPTTAQPTVKKGCGELMKQTTRIVGGQPADKGEWPWMAALLRDKTDQYCGGVLITDQHILTASHCVDNFKPEEVTVRLGEYDFSQVSEARRNFAAEAIFMHESYDRKTYKNDIALIKLKEKATFNNDIWPICLPPSNIVLEGQSAYVTGWGTTSYSGQASDVLLEVILPIWKLADCKAAYTQPISELQLCAGYKQGGKDSCQGDSGGPLMYQMASGRWAAVGVVSWGIRCAEKDKPGVYSRVTAYSDWIKAKVLS